MAGGAVAGRYAGPGVMGAGFAAVGRCGVCFGWLGRSYGLAVFTRVERWLAIDAGGAWLAWTDVVDGAADLQGARITR